MRIRALLSGLFAVLLVSSLFAQRQDWKTMNSAERAKNTVDRISKTVTFTAAQKSNLVTIYTKFYDDVHAQQAFRDPAKLEPLEKARDAKVEKMLNNKKVYKQYLDTVNEMKAQFQERQRQHQQGQH